MIDSVFSPLLLSPPIPAASDRALQDREDQAIAALKDILEDSIDQFLTRTEGRTVEQILAEPVLPGFRGQADPVLVGMCCAQSLASQHQFR
jgi:hypothetical protein